MDSNDQNLFISSGVEMVAKYLSKQIASLSYERAMSDYSNISLVWATIQTIKTIESTVKSLNI